MSKIVTKEDIIKRFKQKHNELYDYSLVYYKRCDIPIEIIYRTVVSIWELDYKKQLKNNETTK